MDYIVLPAESCYQSAILLAANFFVSFLLPCNAWPFLRPIWALPDHFCPRWIIAVCTALWATTLSPFLIFPGISMISERNDDGSCDMTTDYNSRLLCIPIITMVIFDTVTMVVIMTGFVKQNLEPSWIGKLKASLSTKSMGHTSGVFLRSGQIYYMYVLGDNMDTKYTNNF